MRRMGRWACNAVTLLSLLLCLATAGWWARSYLASDRVIFYGYENDGPWLYWIQTQINVGRGAIGFERSSQGIEPPIREQFLQRFGGRTTTHLAEAPAYPDFHAKPTDLILGVRFGHFSFWDEGQGHRPRAKEFYVILPLAYPLIASLGVALLGLRAWRKRRLRRRAGLCPTCQYDLTGNVSGACPECGTTVATPEASHA